MEDKFEKFVRGHRNQLDKHEPREQLWSNIHGKLMQKKSARKRYRVWAAAAALIIAAGALWLLWPSLLPGSKPETPMVRQVQEAESYYASLINEKRKELHAYCVDQKELCSVFEQDMSALDSMYRQLKTEYKASPDKEVVLEAMIGNLRAQLEILGRQLQVIKDIKQKQGVRDI